MFVYNVMYYYSCTWPHLIPVYSFTYIFLVVQAWKYFTVPHNMICTPYNYEDCHSWFTINIAFRIVATLSQSFNCTTCSKDPDYILTNVNA